MSAYNDCRHSWFTRETSLPSRYFTTFDDVAQSYVISNSTVDTSGNTIVIVSDFAIPASYNGVSTLVNLYTDSDSDFHGLLIQFTGVVKYYTNGYTPGQGSTNFKDGRLHTVSVEINKTTGAFSVFVDDVFEYAGTHGNPSFLRDAYFVSVGRRLWDNQGGTKDNQALGIISNAKITTDAGIVFDMPINQNYTPTNNTVLDLSGNGNNGTFVNVADGSSTLYTQNSDGDWVDGSGNVLEVAY